MGLDNGGVISSPTVKLQSPAPATPTAGASPAPPAAAAAAAAAPAASSSADGQGALPFQACLWGVSCVSCLLILQRVVGVWSVRALVVHPTLLY